jgi:DNA (cytosine-5)-methyltransferase 1
LATTPAPGTHAPRLRIGSLCTGRGGLGPPSKPPSADTSPGTPKPTGTPKTVFAHRLPDVPNLTDIRTIDWTAAATSAPVDALTAGFPCQGISNAGKRSGIAGRHSGLWNRVAGS